VADRPDEGGLCRLIFETAMATSGFTAVIKMRDGTPYVLVSAARATAIKPGWRKPLPVLVRINNQSANAWRINMIPSRQQEILRYFSWLKSSVACARNFSKALHVLSGGTGRFLARAWKDGSQADPRWSLQSYHHLASVRADICV